MWTIESEMIGELCSHRPLAMRVLDRVLARGVDRGLDRGLARGVDRRGNPRPAWTISLAELCRDHGLDVAAVLAELGRAEDELTLPWRARPLPELLDHIVRTYHRPFAAELVEAASEIAAAHPPAGAPGHDAWATLVGELAELRADMEQHMAKEEHVLFPWLRGRADTAAAPIRAMQLEHADTINLLHAIRASVTRCLAIGAPGPREEAVATRLDDLERWLCDHIHLESNELFRRALEVEPPRRER